jgi:GDP-4-dehydro-6-deoxy-D-mannose reductase
MTVLVTGATGFTGRAVVRHLEALGEKKIVGLARTSPENPRGNSPVRIVTCDLLDPARVHAVIGNLSPHRIIHLAGLNRGTPEDLLNANAEGTRNLLDAARKADPACRIIVVSSSAVYGYAGQQPIGEGTPLRPVSDYGVSKTAQEQVALLHHAVNGSHVAIARPFNLVGPGQPPSFICGRIVQQVIEIENGQRDALDVLETSSSRDFIDVRDAVRAYWAILSHPEFLQRCSGRAFNIGSGITYAISAVISLIEEITGDRYTIRVPENPPDVPVPFLVSDTTRIRTITGWAPEIPFKESLHDMLEATRGSAVISKTIV